METAPPSSAQAGWFWKKAVYSVAEVATATGLSEQTIRALVRDGRLARVTGVRHILIFADGLRAMFGG